MCLMFLPEADTFTLIHVMIKSTTSNPRLYFNTSHKECALSSLTFDRLVQRHLWGLHKRIILGPKLALSLFLWFITRVVIYLVIY